MREIKFRAWFKEDQEIKEVAMNNVYTGNKGYLYLSPLPMSDYKEIELMQWTGLKDKNGKEIYEGDIVNCFHANNSLVCMKVQTFGLSTNGIGFVPFYEVYGKCEIIGNIYENPEILDA